MKQPWLSSTWKQSAVAAVVGALFALPTLRSYFVADDLVSLYAVLHNPPWRFLYSNWIGAMGAGGFYRPVFNWALGLCYLPNGLDPLPFRVLLIGLFSLNCALIAPLAHRATGSRTGALLAALWFAAHPVHSESIGWIGSILEQLCALFFLLSIRAFDQERIGWSLGFMALALGSKEMGIAIPPVAFLWGALVGRELRRVRQSLPLFLLAAAYVVFRLIILGGMGGYGDRHTQFQVIDNHLVHYLGFLLEPLPTGWLDRGAGGKALAVVAASALGFLALQESTRTERWKGLPIGLGWFFVTWAPVATLLRTQYMFLPSVGAAVCLAAVLGPLLDKRAFTPILGLVWMLYSGNALLAKLKVWEQGGQIVQGVFQQTHELLAGHPRPREALLYEKLPINIGVPVFQHGLNEGLRIFEGRDDLDAARVPTFDKLPPVLDPSRIRFLSYSNGQLKDRTDEIRRRYVRPLPP